jgi:hypothetical protein
MRRHILLGSAAALFASAAASFVGAAPAHAGGEPGRGDRRPLLPPHIAYRDPVYVAPRRPVVLIPVRRVPRSLALPLYNEPPPRFQAL